MADVQLEQGYTRIANRLLEAMIEAGFSERQIRIVLVLIRLTYGWNRRTVQMSEIDLADRCGAISSSDVKRAGGSFRTDLAALVRNEVVVRIEGPSRSIFTWSLNKDYADWGKFSVATSRLRSRWDVRHDSTNLDDEAVTIELAQRRATNDRPESGPSAAVDTDDWPDSRPVSGPVLGHYVDQYRATSAPQSNGNHEVTTLERQGKTLIDNRSTTTAVDAGPSEQSSFAIRLTSAMNAAISKRWGEQPNPLTFGQCQQLAADLILEGFTDLDVARPAIDDACATSRQPTPPGHPNYFRNVIRSAHQSAQQKAFDETESRKRTSHHAPTSVAQVLDPGSVEREVTAKRDYESAINAFAMKWAKKPENENTVRAMHAASTIKFESMLETRWGQVGRDQDILERCRAACGFPDFDDWRQERDRTHMDRTPDQTTPATTAGDST